MVAELLHSVALGRSRASGRQTPTPSVLSVRFTKSPVLTIQWITRMGSGCSTAALFAPLATVDAETQQSPRRPRILVLASEMPQAALLRGLLDVV
jgi:hypothetical protein